jgi:aspartate/methionine/tyrosine aminotransferase
VAGFRSGWLLVSGPRQHAKNYLEGLATLAATRLCPNVPGQYAIQTALGGRQSITDLVLPGGRLREQRNRAWQRPNEIPGVSCAKPRLLLLSGCRAYEPKMMDRCVHGNVHNDPSSCRWTGQRVRRRQG